MGKREKRKRILLEWKEDENILVVSKLKMRRLVWIREWAKKNPELGFLGGLTHRSK